MVQLAARLLVVLGSCLVAPAQSPRLVRDVAPGVLPALTAPRVLGPSARQGEVLLALDDGIHGMELWRSDGTDTGTSLVADLTPGPGGTTFWGVTSLPGAVWFVTGGPGSGDTLWRTVGTSAGTMQVFTSPLGGVTAPDPVLLGDVLFFTTASSLMRTTLAATPGTTFPLPAPPAFVNVVRGGLAALYSSVTGELIVSDGSTVAVLGQNVHLRDYGPGRLMAVETLVAGPVQTRLTLVEAAGQPSITLPGNVGPIELGGTFLLVHSSSTTLSAWNGAGPPMTLATSLSPIDQGQILPGRLVFAAEDAVHGREPWVTDGTVAGTGVLDVTPGPASTTFSIVGGLGNRGLWWVTTTAHGSEPWMSDGTLAGTALLRDLVPGPASSEIDPLFLFTSTLANPGQRRLVLPIATPTTGRELWVTDGTSAGTQLLGDVQPGPDSSLGVDVWFPAAAGNTLVYFADDGVHGVEPWAIDLDGYAAPLAASQTRALTMDDPVLGANWALRCSALAPADLGLVALGLPLALPAPLGNGQYLHFDPAVVFYPLAIFPNPSGEWTASVALPNLPSLVGLDLIAQPLFVPSLQPLGVDLGDAWWLTLGF